MKALPKEGAGGGYFRTSLLAILDDAKTLDEARIVAGRLVADCVCWDDLANVVGAALTREWIPDGASVLDPLPECVRHQARITVAGRWIRRRQLRVVQLATNAAIAAIRAENDALGLPVDEAYARAQMRRWLYPQGEV